MNISDDLWDNIAKYLCYVDLISFSVFAVPESKKYIQKSRYDINEIVLNKLAEKFGNLTYAKLFVNGLVKYNNYISGSFILQCLYDCDWKDSDIDVYCVNKDNCYHHDIEDSINFLRLLTSEWGAELIDCANSYEELHLTQRMYELLNVKINHIVVKPTKLKKINT